VRESQNVLVTENNIRNTLNGVFILDSSHINITSNTIINLGGAGILLEDADSNRISSNKVSNADNYGIMILPDCSNNEIFNNCLQNCAPEDIMDMGSNNNIYDNTCPAVPGYLSIIIVSVVSIVSVLLVITVKRKRKMY
jgi:parallel beta-helix repeat protein